jgi:hypothetical protein
VLFDGDNGAGSNDDSNAQANADANSGGQQGDGTSDKTAVTFTDEQRAELGRIVAKERKAAEAKARADAKADADAAAEQARKDKEADDARKAGDFAKVETQLKTDLDAAKTEATSLKAENDQLRTAIDEALTATVATLPPAIKDILNDTFADDDVLGRYTWLHKPSVQKQLTDAGKDTARGNGGDPKNRGSGNGVHDTAAQQANVRRYG